MEDFRTELRNLVRQCVLKNNVVVKAVALRTQNLDWNGYNQFSAKVSSNY